MPYSGIPAGSAAEAKIERCVERVMAQGHDKSGAIAICRASMGKAMDTENETKETTEQIQGEKMEHGYHDMEESMSYDPVMGAMSFSELDTIQQAQEQHGKLRSIVDNFMRLARNITQNPAIDPTDRSAALRNLTEEMRMRLDADFKTGERTISLPTINGALDRTYLEKLLASDEIYKATKTEGGIEYNASDYADVPDVNMPSTWKLRLTEGRSGNFTVAQVARAITAMQPGGFRGNRVTLTQPKATVISKISAAINKTDGTDAQKANLRERLNAVKSFDFMIGNPPFEQITNHTGFKVLKGTDGSYRWLGWVSNKFMDREGEILTDEAHKDYVAWLDAHPKAAGQLWTFHIPGTGRKSKADFWGYLNGFLLVGGKLTEAEATALQNYKGDLGMSHGFYVLEKKGNLITKYRTFEYTVLPRNAAANPWTKFNVKELESMNDKGLSQAQRDLAVQLHGEDFVNALESDTNKMATVLSEAGVQSKENGDGNGTHKDGSVAGKQADETAEKETTNTGQVDVKELALSVADLVTKQLNPEGLHEAIKMLNQSNSANATAIENLTKRLEALELSDDEKMAKELTPKVPGIDWMGGFRASAAKETIVTDKEKETFKNSKPDESWASNLFNLGNGGL